MQSILVTVNKETDVSFILNFFDKLGMKALIIDEETRQMKARKSLIVLSHKTKKTSISDKEISDEIKAYRKDKHARK
jgi:hypothetical protein